MNTIFIAGCVVVAVVFAFSRVGRDQTISMPAGHVGSNSAASVESLIRSGHKIGAIKLLREQEGLGLKEAKEEVERRERRLKPV